MKASQPGSSESKVFFFLTCCSVTAQCERCCAKKVENKVFYKMLVFTWRHERERKRDRI